MCRHAAFPVKVINWGYWGEVGVAASDDYRRRMARQGIGAIATHEGMAAIQTALGSAAPQLLFLKADQRIRAALHIGSGQTATAPERATVHVVSDALVTPGELLAMPVERAAHAILQGLAQLVSAVFRLDMARICGDGRPLADVRLSALGIDSLMAMELRNRVNAWMKVDIPAHTLIGGTRLDEVAQLLHQKILVRHMNAGANHANQQDGEAETETLVL
jgi:acyl carrier protein